MFIGDTIQPWQVTGGAISDVTIDGRLYRVHVFTSSSNLVVVGPQGVIGLREAAAGLEVEYEIDGGGGGAGSGSTAGWGGPGGGGGSRRGWARLKPGTYSIVIGAGGAAAATLNATTAGEGSNGSDSSAFGLTATGGGGGGYQNAGGPTQGPGKNGGSGGGPGMGANMATASVGTGNTPSTTPAQGSDARAFVGGNGVGWSAIDGTAKAICRGGIVNGGGTAGAANTGNGGSGGASNSLGGAGGSGRVVVRYPI